MIGSVEEKGVVPGTTLNALSLNQGKIPPQEMQIMKVVGLYFYMLPLFPKDNTYTLKNS